MSKTGMTLPSPTARSYITDLERHIRRESTATFYSQRKMATEHYYAAKKTLYEYIADLEARVNTDNPADHG